jgi:cupin 2 domain-containing protein
MKEPVTTGHVAASIPAQLPREFVEVLAGGGKVRIERIVSRGQTTPKGSWFDQPQAEWVLLVQGAARLRLEDEPEERALQPGDWVNIPARVRHRVTWTDPACDTLWIAVFY